MMKNKKQGNTMNRYFNKTALTIICSSMLLLSACGDGGDDFVFVSDKKTFNVDADVKNVVNVHDVFTYTMPSVAKKDIKATTLVFTPKGTAPVGGWPVVVWAHGTTGAADQCAPSRNVLDGLEKDLIIALVKKGYAVVAPDYEGLGNNNVSHPYLNLTSAAQSILFAVLEVNKKYDNLSKNWSVIGWSQGGHAALAAAEFNKALLGYNFKGTVAIAPASYLADTLDFGRKVANDTAAAGDLTTATTIGATLYTYAAIVSSGIKAGQASFNYNQAFLDAKVPIAQQAETLCSPELAQEFGKDIQATLQANGGVFSAYQALQANFKTDPDIAKYLSVNTPAQTKLDKPVYIYQGEADTTVPYPITQKLVDKMAQLGTDVDLELLPKETHSSAVSKHIPELVNTVDVLMKQ